MNTQIRGTLTLKRAALHGMSIWVLGVACPSYTQAAGPGQFPDYFPAATVIKCPFLPGGLEEVPKCAGQPVTCMGTEGPDLILGSDAIDIIFAAAGNDVVHADAGDDIVCGGPGNDSLMGARGADTMLGEEGTDWLFGAPGPDRLYGGPGDYDILWGGPGVDYLDGGPGDFDVCMLQREMGEYDKEGCDTIYPPPGYVHDEDPEAGLLKRPSNNKAP